MEAVGFVTHVARNRRVAIELALLYLVAIQILGCFAISLLVLVFDPKHLIINDPAGYFLRYGLPVFAFSALYFAYHYRRHADAIRRKLKVRLVDARDEKRFVQLAEMQCTALGVRVPRFGILEANEPNALTVGEGPSRGLIVATRGLLDQLNDDELSAVFAHEAAHIKHGDTKLLSLNHVFHRTTVSLSIENPFRLDHWFAFILIIIFPLILPVFIVGNLATWLSMKLTYKARQTLSVRRDFLADAAAIRMTHDPAALVSAIRKTAGKGEFAGAARIAGLLFDSRVEQEGYRAAPIAGRVEAIERLSGELLTMSRTRRDTRSRKFGVAPPVKAAKTPVEKWRIYGENGRPLATPPHLDIPVLKLYFTNRPLFDEWFDATHAYWEWRPSDRRWMSLKPKMIIPLLATLAFVGVFYWPEDGNWRTLAATFDPQKIIELGEKYGFRDTRFCEGPSYPDGKCPD